jgi:acetyl esterase/lipase
MEETKSSNEKYEEDMSVFSLPIRNPTSSAYYLEDHDLNHQYDIYQGNHEKNIIILLHGGYWRPIYTKDHLSPLGGALNDLEYTVYLPEYSRVPGNPDKTFEDIKSFLNLLEQSIPNSKRKIILVGHSVGGHLAIMCSKYSKIFHKMILLAPVADLKLTEELNLGKGAVKDFLGQSLEMRKDLDPMQLQVEKVSTVIIHGKQDTKVPVVISRNYLEYAKKFDVDIKLIELEDFGHFEVINPENVKAFSTLVNELENFTN